MYRIILLIVCLLIGLTGCENWSEAKVLERELSGEVKNVDDHSSVSLRDIPMIMTGQDGIMYVVNPVYQDIFLDVVGYEID